jgi:predicted aspartyl protease
MNNLIWSKEVDTILSIGSPLWDIGVHNWALNRDEARTSILKLSGLKIPILGGEVYKIVDGCFELTYDNWFYSRKALETDLEYLENSVHRALKYIENYPDNSAFFAITPESGSIVSTIIWSREVDDILSVGLSLKDIEINNWALNRDEAITAILKLYSLEIPILGGDVYKIVDDCFDFTYDSWCCDKNIGETDSQYLKRSIDESLQYIKNYLDDNVFFAIVPKI